MDVGLLILRLLIGGLVGAHALQKMFGAFGGHGPDGTAPLFEMWGLRPGKPLVYLAATLELIGSTLLITGLAIALGASMVFGVMVVAASVNFSKGLWAIGGGYELPLTYGIVAAALGFTGAGNWSLDHAFDIAATNLNVAGGIAAGVGAVAAACFIAYAQLHRQPQENPAS